MTFTITQTPNTQNLFLYPSANYSAQLTPYGSANNYDCINEEYGDEDDDSTYVYSSAVATKTDYYTLQNHTSETGTINYVKVVARSKSDTIAQHSSGSYYIYIDDGVLSAHGLNKAPLNTSYQNFYEIFTSKPEGGSWDWTTIDNLRIGIQCSSPTITGAILNLTLRPNGAGHATDYNPLSVHGGTYGWQCVDDVTHDSLNTYVYANGSDDWYADLYTLENHTTQTGTINYVNIVAVMESKRAGYWYYGWIILGTGSPPYDTGSAFNGPYTLNYNVWQTASEQYTTNPYTSSAWTWSDIDSLQIGVELGNYLSTDGAVCTQLYAVVNYTEEYNPQIRTTQVYAVVNYDPESTILTLNMPESLELSHARNIKRHIFQKGTYSVDDFGRTNKTLHLTGTETSDVYNKMNTLRNMCNYDAEVTIAGLPDSNLNTTYRITDFSFKRDAGDVTLYNWDITLEET